MQTIDIQKMIDRKALELFKQYADKLEKQKLLPNYEKEKDNET